VAEECIFGCGVNFLDFKVDYRNGQRFVASSPKVIGTLGKDEGHLHQTPAGKLNKRRKLPHHAPLLNLLFCRELFAGSQRTRRFVQQVFDQLLC